MLEIGCGQGGFAVRLARRYRYIGIEPDTASWRIARTRLEGLGEVRNGDLSVVGADEQFDLVCAFEVLEHIPDDRAALAGWLQHVRPGGWLLLSAPAWPDRFAAWDEMVAHQRRYDPRELAQVLAGLGLEDVEATAFGAPLGYVLEAMRNAIARRRLTRVNELSSTERTAESGRLLTPRDGMAAAMAYVLALPFRKLQHAFPGKGVGLVARGRRPAAS